MTQAGERPSGGKTWGMVSVDGLLWNDVSDDTLGLSVGPSAAQRVELDELLVTVWSHWCDAHPDLVEVDGCLEKGPAVRIIIAVYPRSGGGSTVSGIILDDDSARRNAQGQSGQPSAGQEGKRTPPHQTPRPLTVQQAQRMSQQPYFHASYGGRRGGPETDWYRVRRVVREMGYDHFWRDGNDWWTPVEAADGVMPAPAVKVELLPATYTFPVRTGGGRRWNG